MITTTLLIDLFWLIIYGKDYLKSGPLDGGMGMIKIIALFVGIASILFKVL